MDKRKITGILIGLFIAISVIFLAAKEIIKSRSITSPNIQIQKEIAVKHHLKIFYFHGNVRCPSCKKIEAYTKETITSRYKTEMGSGLIEFSEVNIDKPENERFIEQYRLTTKQIIVSEFENGKEKRWKNLDRVWELLGNKEDFQSYQEMEITAWLNRVRK